MRLPAQSLAIAQNPLYLLTFAFILVFAPARAFAIEREVRVQLFARSNGVDELVIKPPYRIVYPATLAATGSQVRVTPGLQINSGGAGLRSDRLVVESSGRALVLAAGGVEKKITGRVIVTTRGGKLALTAVVPALDYIASSVGSESPPGFLPEALKAQAILVSSYLATRGGIIRDDTSDLAYSGADYARPECVAAARAVLGKILVDEKGRTLKPYFCSTCGGRLSTARAIFSGKAGALATPDRCGFCKASPFYREQTSRINATDIVKALGYEPVSISATDDAGRPLAVSVMMRRGVQPGAAKTITGYQHWLDIGQKLGWGKVPGMQYSFEREGAGYVYKSRGAGHGIGYCQWGGNGMATKSDYKQILRYYFPSARVQ